MSVALSDFKSPRHVTFQWDLKGGDFLDPSRRWTAAQLTLHRLQGRLRASRNYFNRSVREIAYVPAEPESLGFGRDKPPEPDPLNSAPDNPVA
jgi:hypothetical protein